MAKERFTLSQEAIRQLGDDHEAIERLRRDRPPRDAAPFSRFREKQVRIGRTTTGLTCTTYPSRPANTYVVELGKPKYEESCGENETEFTPYKPVALRWAHNIFDDYIKEGTLVYLLLMHDQWYIVGVVGVHGGICGTVVTSSSATVDYVFGNPPAKVGDTVTLHLCPPCDSLATGEKIIAIYDHVNDNYVVVECPPDPPPRSGGICFTLLSSNVNDTASALVDRLIGNPPVNVGDTVTIHFCEQNKYAYAGGQGVALYDHVVDEYVCVQVESLAACIGGTLTVSRFPNGAAQQTLAINLDALHWGGTENDVLQPPDSNEQTPGIQVPVIFRAGEWQLAPEGAWVRAERIGNDYYVTFAQEITEYVWMVVKEKMDCEFPPKVKEGTFQNRGIWPRDLNPPDIETLKMGGNDPRNDWNYSSPKDGLVEFQLYPFGGGWAYYAKDVVRDCGEFVTCDSGQGDCVNLAKRTVGFQYSEVDPQPCLSMTKKSLVTGFRDDPQDNCKKQLQVTELCVAETDPPSQPEWQDFLTPIGVTVYVPSATLDGCNIVFRQREIKTYCNPGAIQTDPLEVPDCVLGNAMLDGEGNAMLDAEGRMMED